MADKILLRRGNFADLPTLSPGEPGFALDDKRFFIGTSSGNSELAMSEQPVWLNPTLLNSWTNHVAGPNIGYYKDTVGIVHLQGLIQGGTTTVGTLIFTLPTGYRPFFGLRVPITCSNTTSITSGVMLINTNGNCTIETAVWVSNYVTLTGINFRAEQ